MAQIEIIVKVTVNDNITTLHMGSTVNWKPKKYTKLPINIP